jgi:chromosome segregation ATPase
MPTSLPRRTRLRMRSNHHASHANTAAQAHASANEIDTERETLNQKLVVAAREMREQRKEIERQSDRAERLDEELYTVHARLSKVEEEAAKAVALRPSTADEAADVSLNFVALMAC